MEVDQHQVLAALAVSLGSADSQAVPPSVSPLVQEVVAPSVVADSVRQTQIRYSSKCSQANQFTQY